ncbi:MAG: hypothetical protein ACRC4M_04230 [Mycoplasma sp.]
MMENKWKFDDKIFNKMKQLKIDKINIGNNKFKERICLCENKKMITTKTLILDDRELIIKTTVFETIEELNIFLNEEIIDCDLPLEVIFSVEVDNEQRKNLLKIIKKYWPKEYTNGIYWEKNEALIKGEKWIHPREIESNYDFRKNSYLKYVQEKEEKIVKKNRVY